MKDIVSRLLELKDSDYKAFQCKLMPTVALDKVIGVRTPALRKLATEMWKNGKAEGFMSELPHMYYEENNLHAFLIEKLSDYDECIKELNRFLPYVDNWATCDMMSPKILTKNTDKLYGQIKVWISSGHIYTVRYGIKTLMSLYSDDHFSKEQLELVAKVRSDEYYIKMAIAWYFATELAFHYDATLAYLEDRRLDTWTHNKAIQKAIESYRVTDEHKAQLKGLKI